MDEEAANQALIAQMLQQDMDQPQLHASQNPQVRKPDSQKAMRLIGGDSSDDVDADDDDIMSDPSYHPPHSNYQPVQHSPLLPHVQAPATVEDEDADFLRALEESKKAL